MSLDSRGSGNGGVQQSSSAARHLSLEDIFPVSRRQQRIESWNFPTETECDWYMVRHTPYMPALLLRPSHKNCVRHIARKHRIRGVRPRSFPSLSFFGFTPEPCTLEAIQRSLMPYLTMCLLMRLGASMSARSRHHPIHRLPSPPFRLSGVPLL